MIPTNTTDNPFKKITGDVNTTVEYDEDGNPVAYQSVWLGDIVGVTKELVEQADPRFIALHDDGTMTIGAYYAQVLEYYPPPYNLYLIKRIEPVEWDGT